jgi:hypothetical protein
VHFTSLPTRKRKRAASSSEDEYPEQYSGRLAAASTNPLSLTPDEIAQYRLAGLDLDEEVPNIRGWPHRGLSREEDWFTPDTKKKEKDRKGKGKAIIEENDEEMVDDKAPTAETSRSSQGPKLRMQHLGVLTAILNKCLLEGDMARANRAWSMLIRAQIRGLGVDIRETGYWGVGVELLTRSGENRPRDRTQIDDDSDYEADDEDNSNIGAQRTEQSEQRWGTKEGSEKAKAYLERLILQFPYKRQFHNTVNPLDFWPQMVTDEIYDIQYEQRQSLKKIANAEEKDEDDEASDSDSDAFEDAESHVSQEDDDDFTIEKRRKDKRRRRKAEKRWTQKDDVRQTALVTAETIAARLDELMVTPPYSDSHVLLRLRGMLSLYIGEVSVPAMPITGDEEEDTAEQRFLFRQRISEHERGKRRLEEEQAKARRLFAKIAKDGGDTSDPNGLYLGHEEDEMEVNYDD